jgi:hypothetical protein
MLLGRGITAQAQPAPDTMVTEPTGSPGSGPVMLSETATFTDVVDAFDHGSTWSFRLSAGYQYQLHTATVERELRAITDPSTGIPQVARVGQYRETTHTLLANAELALYHDLALTFGVPVVLSNTRELRRFPDANATEGQAALSDGWTHEGMPTSLFQLGDSGFRGPERAGIDQVRLGLSWSILNQQRDRSKPTWVVRFEWRPPVGPTMRACNSNPAMGVASCPSPESVPTVPASGVNSTGPTLRSAPMTGGGAGISRGLHGLYFQTSLSRRMGYVEPYAALDVLAEFPQRDTPFKYLDTPYGLLANFPPIVGNLTVGAEVIPWENRETWQRVLLDFRVRGTYRSQGRDYSVLYDALGSSPSRALALAGCPSNVRNDDGTCQPGRSVFFDGLTSTASSMALGTNITLAFQAARFLRFSVVGGLTWVTPRTITATDACNPSTNPPPEHPEWRGGCVSNSAPDPLHRPAIDAPGNRFRTSDEFYWDLAATLTLTPRFD